MGRLAGEPSPITFVPHLAPMDRGILSTVYAQLREAMTEDSIRSLYEQFYRDEPFVRLVPAGVYPATKLVAHTNYCDIGLKVDARANRLIVMSTIDNLVKGASGQAIQCFNISFGLPETQGLP